MNKLELEILDIINDSTESEYIGKLSVKVDEDIYSLYLFHNQNESPMVLSYQGTEDEFKGFINKEMAIRKIESVDFWNALKFYEPSVDALGYDQIINDEGYCK